MVTSARVQILNDGPRTIIINTESYDLKNDLATPLSVGAGLPKPDPPAGIQAGEGLSQSWIKLQWYKNDLSVNLGRGTFETGLRSKSSAEGQSEIVCAPVDPLDAKGWDFFFWFLVSQGNLQKLVNSLVDANREALINTLKKTEIQGFKVKDVNVTELKCTYAAVSKQGKRTPWMANIVLTFSGRIKGATGSQDLDIGAGSLQVMLSVTIDTRDSKEKLKVTVTRLQCAAKSIDGIPWVPSNPLSYYVPAIVNTTKNAQILDELNKRIKEWVAGLRDLGMLEKYNLEPYIKPPVSVDHRSWMSNPRVQAKKLSQLKIPGTHDSAAYALEHVLTPILFDLAFLEKVYPTSAPSDHDYKSKEYYIGQTAYTWLMENISYIGQTHDSSRTIQKQLEEGIRFFDIRVYYDERVDDYYLHHSLRLASLSVILDQIKAFLSADSKATEFAIFQIWQSWQTFDKPDVATHAARVAKMVKEKLGQWLWLPEAAAPDQPFDFQKLGSLTLSDITASSSKVLWIDTDNRKYPHSILNTIGSTVYPKKDDAAPGSGLYGHWLTMTPDTNEVAGSILMNWYNADEKKPIKILQRASRKLNSTIRQVLKDKPYLNMIAMDWYTEADEDLPVDVIISANQ